MTTGTYNALPEGLSLNDYRIDSVLGVGGFGVTYLATDRNLELKVALKEYLPVDHATRGADNTVHPRTDADSDSFHWGRRRFLDEARTLASFHHPNIVRVMRFFEANNTGYMVMEFVDGEPLSTWISKRRPLPQADLLGIAGALLDGLNVMHNASYLHRDVKPANIFMRGDGSPVLIDFGSARSVNCERGMTAMVTPGYAPLEQYHAHGNQGPWTDLYALGGVMYWMVTGVKPLDAAARVRNDNMTPASIQAANGLYGAEMLRAIDWALKSNEDERPQSAAEFRSRLRIDRATHRLHRADPTSATAGDTTLLLTGSFEPDLVKRIEAEAARALGPIAPLIVRKAARSALTLSELCNTVAKEIEDEKTRLAFLKKFANEGRTGPPTHPPTHPFTQPRSMPAASVSAKFSPDILQRAEAELARHIGAIANVVIRKAAAKARDESELYLLIADEIQDPVEKKAFVRKAVTASRRPK